MIFSSLTVLFAGVTVIFSCLNLHVLVEGQILTKESSSKRWIAVFEKGGRYSWTAANRYCQEAFGTTLASYHNAEDELEVSNTRYNYATDTWIGLTDRRSEAGRNGGIGSGWEWIDGSCYNFEVNWDSGEPDNAGVENFVHFRGNSDILNDASNSNTDKLNSFICNYMTFTDGSINVDSIDNHVFSLDESQQYCNGFFGSSLVSTNENMTAFACAKKQCASGGNSVATNNNYNYDYGNNLNVHSYAGSEPNKGINRDISCSYTYSYMNDMIIAFIAGILCSYVLGIIAYKCVIHYNKNNNNNNNINNKCEYGALL